MPQSRADAVRALETALSVATAPGGIAAVQAADAFLDGNMPLPTNTPPPYARGPVAGGVTACYSAFFEPTRARAGGR